MKTIILIALIALPAAAFAVTAADVKAWKDQEDGVEAAKVVYQKVYQPQVGSGITLCPDGNYVGHSPCALCPDGKYVAGHCQLAPNGKWIGD